MDDDTASSADPKDQDYFILETQERSQQAPRKDERIPCYLRVLTFMAILGGFLFGYDTGVISGAMVFIKDQFLLDIIWQQFIVSITIATAAIFASIAGYFSHWLGRRVVILISAAVFAIGSIELPLANSKEALLVGRFIQGVSIGMASATVPVYISECSPASRRGFLITCFNMSIVLGQFMAAVIAGLFSYDSRNGWRYMLGLATVPAVIQFVAFLFLPETPRWLIKGGRDTQARQALNRMRSDSDADVEAEFQQIQSTVANESQKDKRFVIFEMLKYGPVRRALVVGCGLQLFAQLAGINTVMYYGATIFKMAGIQSPSLSVWLTTIPGGVNVIGMTLSLFLVDRVGRRPLVLISMLGVVITLFWLGLGFFLSQLTTVLVTVTETTNASSVCNSKLDCNSCMMTETCGLCYNDNTVGIANASCVSLMYRQPDILAGWGRCSQQPMPPNVKLAHDYCPSQQAWLTLSGMMLYLLAFSFGMGPMAWTVNAEIYPMWARSTGTAAATSTNWTCNFLVSVSFLSLTRLITTYGTFWLYTGISLCGLLFFILTLPESKGKTLEEVENLFNEPWCCGTERRPSPIDSTPYIPLDDT